MAEEEEEAIKRAAIEELLASAGVPGIGAGLAGPLHWPQLTAEHWAKEMRSLRAWVERLVRRFDLDAHVVPPCWWRHNHLVEALGALRDHERACYAPASPATAAVEFHRARRDIEALLRAWVAGLRCEGGHDPAHDKARRLAAEGWEDWLARESGRRQAETAPAASEAT